MAQEPLQIDVEGTPNPNSVKVVLNRVLADDTRSYFNAGMVAENDQVAAVAKQLFAISGVKTLMFRPDFVTVSKEANADWNAIMRDVERILTEQYQ